MLENAEWAGEVMVWLNWLLLSFQTDYDDPLLNLAVLEGSSFLILFKGKILILFKTSLPQYFAIEQINSKIEMEP